MIKTIQLPFPCNSSLVSGLLHEMTEGFFIWIEITKMGIITKIVLPCHNFHP